MARPGQNAEYIRGSYWALTIELENDNARQELRLTGRDITEALAQFEALQIYGRYAQWNVVAIRKES